MSLKNAYLPPVEGLNDEATDWLIGLLQRTHFVNIHGRHRPGTGFSIHLGHPLRSVTGKGKCSGSFECFERNYIEFNEATLLKKAQ